MTSLSGGSSEVICFSALYSGTAELKLKSASIVNGMLRNDCLKHCRHCTRVYGMHYVTFECRALNLVSCSRSYFTLENIVRGFVSTFGCHNVMFQV